MHVQVGLFTDCYVFATGSFAKQV